MAIICEDKDIKDLFESGTNSRGHFGRRWYTVERTSDDDRDATFLNHGRARKVRPITNIHLPPSYAPANRIRPGSASRLCPAQFLRAGTSFPNISIFRPLIILHADRQHKPSWTSVVSGISTVVYPRRKPRPAIDQPETLLLLFRYIPRHTYAGTAVLRPHSYTIARPHHEYTPL